MQIPFQIAKNSTKFQAESKPYLDLREELNILIIKGLNRWDKVRLRWKFLDRV